jgi:inner membrane protein
MGKNEKFTDSITFKSLIVGILILVMFIPNVMIQNLIYERKERSRETIRTINEKWSLAQKITGPILAVPYITTLLNSQNQEVKSEHVLYVAPQELDIDVELFPEERYYGIYKAMLYQSRVKIKGNFSTLKDLSVPNSEIHWEKASVLLGISDLRGVVSHAKMNLQGKELDVKAGEWIKGDENALIFDVSDGDFWNDEGNINYHCELKLNGSEKMNFIPVGKNSHVVVKGVWPSPGFIGKFSPTYTISTNGFEASWNVLEINRAIPATWTENTQPYFDGSSFGICLVEMVDHYQQNTRSAKYSMLFIALTFLVFFFVELLTKKRIHPVQYLLVGLALMIFYTLLLSISERIGFGIAYFIASIATISLITGYAYSIFKNLKTTSILFGLLFALYLFLYMILQMEDTALLIGSIGLFVILGVAMYASRKVKWYK